MDLYEYQARELFAQHGVPVPSGEVAATPAAAAAAAACVGGKVVLKAQVKTGGRGKAGGVHPADVPVDAARRADDILGLDIKGHRTSQVLVTEAASIAAEYYVSFLLDRANRGFLAIASAEGGIEIEQLAAERPEALATVPIDPLAGVSLATATKILVEAGFPDEVIEEAAGVLVKMWEVFVAEDATLVEVNPLIRDSKGRIIALDAKVVLDDNADFRQPSHAALADGHADDPLEAAAKAKDLNYVKLDGEVGVIGNGAGLVMSTLDVVAYTGERFGGITPANFLDIGGGASAEVMAAGLEVILSDQAVRSVFVNVFGGITSCDAVANGIVRAVELLAEQGQPLARPLVVRLDGNNAEEGRRILEEANLTGVIQVDTMDAAAERAAQLAAGV